MILDDLACAQKDQAETSVLFELIAHGGETRSLAVAANQPFSAWDRAFPDPAVTVAAVDRLVHHATILEMNVDSHRRRRPPPAARRRRRRRPPPADKDEAVAAPTTPTDNHEGARRAEPTSTAADSTPANLVAGAGQEG